MDFNATKRGEALRKYLSNDVFNISVASIFNEILTYKEKMPHADEYVLLIIHNK